MMKVVLLMVSCITLPIITSNTYAEVASNDTAEHLVEYADSKDNWPILHYAIENERPDVALEALQYYPEQAFMLTPEVKLMESHFGKNARDDYDFQVGTEQGVSALELAVRKGYLNLTKQLLELGCNPNEIRTEYFGYMSDYWDPGKGPFVYENVKFVNNYVRGSNYWTRSILYWAVESNNAEMVKMLLKAGASLNGIKAQRNWRVESSFNIERTSVHQAAYMACDEILEILISYQYDSNAWENQIVDRNVLTVFRAYVNNGSGWPPLHSALKNLDRESFHLFLKYGEDPRWQGRAPDSLLNMAVGSEDPYFLDLMASYGINPAPSILD